LKKETSFSKNEEEKRIGNFYCRKIIDIIFINRGKLPTIIVSLAGASA